MILFVVYSMLTYQVSPSLNIMRYWDEMVGDISFLLLRLSSRCCRSVPYLFSCVLRSVVFLIVEFHL